MISKLSVLENLTRDELLGVVDAFEIQVEDRRVKEKLVEAVACSRKATLAAFLPDFSRDRLKELCRLLNLDDSGREKSLVVGQLTGPSPEGRSCPALTACATRRPPLCRSSSQARFM